MEIEVDKTLSESNNVRVGELQPGHAFISVGERYLILQIAYGVDIDFRGQRTSDFVVCIQLDNNKLTYVPKSAVAEKIVCKLFVSK